MQKRHEEFLTLLCLRHSEINSFRLCFVEEDTAFFTNHFEDQWGDDWDDAPYEHNAGVPYTRAGNEIYVIKFTGCFETPGGSYYNSPYSVLDINAKKVPWLTSTTHGGNNTTKISVMWAGSVAKEFIIFVLEQDGEIFIRMN